MGALTDQKSYQMPRYGGKEPEEALGLKMCHVLWGTAHLTTPPGEYLPSGSREDGQLASCPRLPPEPGNHPWTEPASRGGSPKGQTQ